MLRRIRNTRIGLETAQTQASGSFDRVHAGLVTGWFRCSICEIQEVPSIQVLAQTDTIEVSTTRVARSDVPGGGGFVARFDRQMVPVTPSSIAARCLKHPSQFIQAAIATSDWQITSLGAIESAQWPLISGWFLQLDPETALVLLRISGCDPVNVDNFGPRPDVASFLGSSGLRGFHVNIADKLGFAPTDGSTFTLEVGGVEFAHGQVVGSPVNEIGNICTESRTLMTPNHSRLSQGERLTIAQSPLQLIDTGNSATPAEWVGQWRSFFTHEGVAEELISAWLLLEQSNLLGVSSLSQVPRWLNALANSQVSPSSLLGSSTPITNLQAMYGMVFQQSDASLLTHLMAERLSAVYDVDRYLKPPMLESGDQASVDLWQSAPSARSTIEKVWGLPRL